MERSLPSFLTSRKQTLPRTLQTPASAIACGACRLPRREGRRGCLLPIAHCQLSFPTPARCHLALHPDPIFRVPYSVFRVPVAAGSAFLTESANFDASFHGPPNPCVCRLPFASAGKGVAYCQLPTANCSPHPSEMPSRSTSRPDFRVDAFMRRCVICVLFLIHCIRENPSHPCHPCALFVRKAVDNHTAMPYICGETAI